MATSLLRPFKVSALYRAHQGLGARWVEDGEWRLVEAFADPDVEAEKVRQGVGLQDVSAIGKLDLKGREVERVLDGFGSHAQLSVLRLRPDHYLILTPPGRQGSVAEAMLQTLSQAVGCAHLTDVTSAISAFTLVGPRAREVLAKLTSLDLRPHIFPNEACSQGGLARVHAIIVRDDWGRLPAYRLLLGREHTQYGWEAVRTAGAALGLIPFGMAAERLLRPRRQD
ncbi:MAG: hypothetical protein HY726_03360 [Candidatus Rokubacteria bacterium]|nr:hypothetical protein [Candidatus Rokubacteria bacterium]